MHQYKAEEILLFILQKLSLIWPILLVSVVGFITLYRRVKKLESNCMDGKCFSRHWQKVREIEAKLNKQ